MSFPAMICSWQITQNKAGHRHRRKTFCNNALTLNIVRRYETSLPQRRQVWGSPEAWTFSIYRGLVLPDRVWQSRQPVDQEGLRRQQNYCNLNDHQVAWH